MNRIDAAVLAAPAQAVARFWSRVDRAGPSECWPWTARRSPGGYGVFRLPVAYARANRMAFLLSGGRFSPEAPICLHSCDRPECCNPAHLRAGSNADNIRDREERDRSAKGIRNGAHTHPDSRARGMRNHRARHPEEVRGTRNPNARFTEEDVIAIRARRGSGETLRSLAAAYRCSEPAISHIVSRRSWGHVP